jgi:MYXO-CTERM domain-containing protein
MAGPVLYDFDVVGGGIILQIVGAGSTVSGMDGTFSALIYQSNCHIGESDTFILDGAFLTNTDTAGLGIAGLATAWVLPGSARFLDFIQPDPAHIGPGGHAVVMTDAYMEATVLVTGAFTTTFSTATTAGTLVPVSMIFITSGLRSDIVEATLGIYFPYSVGISDLGMTITLDLIVSVTGTAHVVPDPALGGLTALGLGGAAAWLRRRS